MDQIYQISLILVVVILFTLWLVQQSSKKCPYVFKVPSSDMATKYFPTQRFYSGVSRNGTGGRSDGDIDPINDRVNEQYRPNPNYERKEGMGDITSGMWMSKSSHAGKSNDGRVIVDDHMATDLVTPEFCNQIADKCGDLARVATTKSKMEDFRFDGAPGTYLGNN